MSTLLDNLDPSRLIEHADRLLAAPGVTVGRPFDMDLRRAASASYYALFHAISLQVSLKLFGDSSAARQHAVRWINHSDISSATRFISSYSASATGKPATKAEKIAVRALLDNAPPGPQLVSICETFRRLQDVRHDADYGRAKRITKPEAQLARDDAIDAINALYELVQRNDEAVSTFLGLVAFAARRLPTD